MAGTAEAIEAVGGYSTEEEWPQLSARLIGCDVGHKGDRPERQKETLDITQVQLIRNKKEQDKEALLAMS